MVIGAERLLMRVTAGHMWAGQPHESNRSELSSCCLTSCSPLNTSRHSHHHEKDSKLRLQHEIPSSLPSHCVSVIVPKYSASGLSRNCNQLPYNKLWHPSLSNPHTGHLPCDHEPHSFCSNSFPFQLKHRHRSCRKPSCHLPPFHPPLSECLSSPFLASQLHIAELETDKSCPKMQPLPSDKPTFSSQRLPKLTDLPVDVLRRITLYVMETQQSSHSDRETNPFLNASHPAFLRNGIRLAVTCRLMLNVFHDALTAIKLVSSWQTNQNTLTAACRIASNNLRALHVECSAPVTGALREVICMRPPIRHFVLIGVNISKLLMADIVFFVGHTVRKLVISAAPSLDDCIVDLISAKCANLQYLELGGSRRVTNESLLNLFDNIGHGLRGIELNALQHDSLDERILLNVAHHCSNLTFIRLLKLRWVTDPSLEHFFKLRAHQLTEVRIEACRQVSYHSLCLLKRLGTTLESLTCTFTNYEWMSIHTPDLIRIHNVECDERCPAVYKRDMNFCLGENALTKGSLIMDNLRELRLTDSVITDEIANRLLCSLHNLENLTLRHCTSLGDLSLQSIAGNATGLKYLDISYLPLITDDGVEFLLSALRTSLHEVRILGCTSLTDRTATDILPSCGMQLKMVRLSYCLFSRQAISKLKESLPRTTLCGSSGCSFQ